MKRRPPPLDKPYPRHRPASDEETRIWRTAMGEESHEKVQEEECLPESVTPEIRRSTPLPPVPAAQKKPGPEPETVDVRTRKKILRGRLEVQATLDLHGYTRHEAHAVLVRFIARAQAKNIGLALIITGKGNAGKPGILREELPRWLNEPPLRTAIIAYDAAGPSHGGGGAWYVRIRKQKPDQA